MPLPQTRLLRVLAEDEFFRVGGRRLIQVDVQVIAATHQDLDAKAGRWRVSVPTVASPDVVRLDPPPCVERREDISLLAEYFLQQAADEPNGARDAGPDAMARLVAHDWPAMFASWKTLPARGRAGVRRDAARR